MTTEEKGAKPKEKGLKTEVMHPPSGTAPEVMHPPVGSLPQPSWPTNRVGRFNRRLVSFVSGQLKAPGTPMSTATWSGSSEHPAEAGLLAPLEGFAWPSGSRGASSETNDRLPTHDWLLLKLCGAMLPALSREVYRELHDV